MINSYRQLAAEGLYEELIDDVQELLNSASEHSLTADTLVVGKLFLEVSAIKAVNNQFNIKSFPNHPDILEAYIATIKEKIFSIYEKCASNQGQISVEVSQSSKIDIVYNPDEYYITLLCLDSHGKYVDTKSSSNNPYVSLYFKDSEILIDYLFIH